MVSRFRFQVSGFRRKLCLQAGQKTLRCKAREDRRAEAYSGSTLERSDRGATKQMGLFQRRLRIITVGAATSHQVTDIAPGSQHPVAVLVSEDVETGIHEFETPRRFKWDCKGVPKKTAQHTAVSDHDDSFPEMLLGNFVEIRDVPLNLLSHALSARDDITWTHSSVQSILFREFFPELVAVEPLKDT